MSMSNWICEWPWHRLGNFNKELRIYANLELYNVGVMPYSINATIIAKIITMKTNHQGLK